MKLFNLFLILLTSLALHGCSSSIDGLFCTQSRKNLCVKIEEQGKKHVLHFLGKTGASLLKSKPSTLCHCGSGGGCSCDFQVMDIDKTNVNYKVNIGDSFLNITSFGKPKNLPKLVNKKFYRQ